MPRTKSPFNAVVITNIKPVFPKAKSLSTENWNPTEKYNQIAGEYDAASQELFLGITFMRWWTTRQVTGRVLEVCAGTGKNVPFYDVSKVKEIHFLDQSPAMLDQCKQKWTKRGESKIPVSFFVSSIESFPVPIEKYDTVYQTQGLMFMCRPRRGITQNAVTSEARWEDYSH